MFPPKAKKAPKARSATQLLLKRGLGAASVAITGFFMYGRVLKHYAPPPGAKFGKTWSDLAKFAIGKTFLLALAGVAAFVLVSFGGIAAVCWLGTQQPEKQASVPNLGVVRTVYWPVPPAPSVSERSKPAIVSSAPGLQIAAPTGPSLTHFAALEKPSHQATEEYRWDLNYARLYRVVRP